MNSENKLALHKRLNDNSYYGVTKPSMSSIPSKYDEVVQDANKLAKVMGKHWKPHVWENLGWNYCVFLDDTSTTISFNELTLNYTVMLNVSEKQFIFLDEDPKKAFSSAMMSLKEYINKLCIDEEYTVIKSKE